MSCKICTPLLLLFLTTCGAAEETSDVAAEVVCVPDCAGDPCGLDGCGAICGVCAAHQRCVARACVSDTTLVPSGPFKMGCNANSDDFCKETEQPEHTVEIADFWVDVVEVSVLDYRSCVLAGKCTEPGSGDYCNWGDSERLYHPLNCVTWFQAEQFCQWEGKRLCTEAEWEKAARGPDALRFPWGNRLPDCQLASWGAADGQCTENSTSEVGTHPAGVGPHGVFDASGNVWEWVADWYDGAWYQQVDGEMGPDNGEFRVVRGGSFASAADELRLTHRSAQRPDQSGVGLGFRCCMSPPL